MTSGRPLDDSRHPATRKCSVNYRTLMVYAALTSYDAAGINYDSLVVIH